MFTGYFSKLKEYEDRGLIPVGICGARPDFYKGNMYTKLGPKKDFFTEWKYGSHKGDNEYYVEHYKSEVLDTLDFNTVLEELSQFGELGDIILLCYERPDNFCHRHLVADWMEEHQLRCTEYDLNKDL